MSRRQPHWPLPPRAIYLVTDPTFVSRTALVAVAKRAVAAGASMVQLRDKDAPTRTLVEDAKALVGALSVPVIVNDRVDVALASGAAGVHLGQSDMRAQDARRVLGESAIIGLSIEHIDELDDDKSIDAADYLAASPVFSTTTKDDVAPPLGLSGIRKVAEASGRPTVGIGGIHASNCGSVFDAGASAVAVVSAILGADDIEAATRALVESAAPSSKEAG